jgi:raffinose/stachyose/melibiose transport system substrate-binding protein
MRYRWIGAGLVAALAASVVTGCGSKTGDGNSTFEFWSQWRKGEPQQQVLEQAIKEFTAQTKIKVKVQWAGRDVGKKIQAGANAGQVPDLTDDASEVLRAGALVGTERGLSDVYAMKVPGTSKTVGDVVPAKYLKPYTVNGQPVLVPYDVLTTSLWFDGKAHPELVGNPPKTWTDFMAALDAFKARGVTPLAADGTVNGYNAYWLVQLTLRQLGPGWLDSAATDKSASKWSDPRFLAAAKAVEALAKGGYFQHGYQGSKLPAAQQAWGQDKMVFLLDGSWAPGEISAYAKKDFDFQTMPFPKTEGGFSSIDTNFIGFGIPTKAKHADAAKRFIAFFMADRWMSDLATKSGTLTPDPDAPVPTGLAGVQKLLDQATQTNRPLDGASGDAPQWWSNVFLPLDNKLFYGQLTAEQFVSELAKQSKQFWQNS